LKLTNLKKLFFSVGTQINGIPHIGTYIVQCASFLLAKKVREKFKIATSVEFGALDNAPFDVVKSSSGYSYQRTYFHVLSSEDLDKLISTYYTPYFSKLQELTDVEYKMTTYAEAQKIPIFRKHFLKTLHCAEKIGWCVGPSTGMLRIRIPCPQCFYAEKYSERTELVRFNDQSATFRCMCINHGLYEATIQANGQDNIYLDLNTLYRNLIKEASTTDDPDKLYVMVKGGDWVFSTQMVDWALGVLGYSAIQVPMRIFTPQIVTETGAKLSKSLIRDGDASMDEVPEWIIDMGKFKEQHPITYVDHIVWLMEMFLSHPRHMYRSYSYQEVIRILKTKENSNE